MGLQDTLATKFGIKNRLAANVIAEFFGTFMLLFIGTCVVSQFHLGREKTTEWIGVNIGWGFAISFCVYATARLSGGHLNPAVSFLMWSMGNLKFTWFLLYSLAQTAGAFFGSALMYLYYTEAYYAYDGGKRVLLGPRGTGVTFCSYPNAVIKSFWTPFFDQIFGTAMLCYFVCVIIDKRNKIPASAHPLLFGLVLTMIGCGFGFHLGYPINPARDFGPRLFSFFIYGSAVFTTPTAIYWLAPTFAPFIGAIVGGWFYHVTLGTLNPDQIDSHLSSEQSKVLIQAEA